MLIDLEELAGEIASKVDGAGLTPVIEKEIVHYEIIRSLGRNGLLQDITFQGGTSLRLCYGSQRYSEDLDFVAGDKFDSLPLDDFSRTLRCDLLRSYDTEVSVREPKVVNDLDGVGMRRWTETVWVDRETICPYIANCQDPDEDMHARLPVSRDIDSIGAHMAPSFSLPRSGGIRGAPIASARLSPRRPG